MLPKNAIIRCTIRKRRTTIIEIIKKTRSIFMNFERSRLVSGAYLRLTAKILSTFSYSRAANRKRKRE